MITSRRWHQVYEHQTYEEILQRMLDRVPDNVDKREGSLIYSALAPAAAELAQMYIELDVLYSLTFVDTAEGEELTKRCAEMGVYRKPATKARREGIFKGSNGIEMDVPIGSRFSIEDVTYKAIEKITTGHFILECETAGTIGNMKFGDLLPIDYIEGLVSATLGVVLIPGEDEESDEALRQRYYQTVNEPAFGGNISDYKQTINAIDGVGGTKVFPVWQGGGTVKCTIISSEYSVPSSQLVNHVQTIVDPIENSGEGLGTAPIGHKVTIVGVTGKTINIETTIALAQGVTVGQVQSSIENVIAEYLLSLRKEWANQVQLVVRIAQIDARILTVPGVVDVSNTKLNGATNNITLGEEEIPILGMVTINA